MHSMRNRHSQSSKYAIWIYKLANSISTFIFLFSQFRNLHRVILIPVTPVTHQMRKNLAYFQINFVFAFYTISRTFWYLIRMKRDYE